MAQWNGQYLGHTHETKAQDIEASLRLAVAAYHTAPSADRLSKSKAVHRLAERLLAARVKLLHARHSDLYKRGLTHPSAVEERVGLQEREQKLRAGGVAEILREFHFTKADDA